MKHRLFWLLLLILAGIACGTAPSSRTPILPSPETPIYLADGRVLTDATGYIEPKVTKRVEPDYAESLRKSKSQGKVVLSCVIDADGNVSGIRVVESAGIGLDEATRKAVSQWKYAPAKLNGENVGVIIRVWVSFTIRG